MLAKSRLEKIMFQEERIYRIAELLKERRSLSKGEIMESLGISRDTARRDILKLVEQGIAIRTHGGIAIAELNLEILSYRRRASINHEVKQALAKYAFKCLETCKVCFFDVSTTIEELCDYVPDGIDVYTHSLDNLKRLLKKNCDIRMFGGKLNRKHHYCYGSDTLAQIEQIRFDLAILGAGGISHDGIYVGAQEDAAIKRKVVERSELVYVLADESKFNSKGHFRCVSFDSIDKIITDRNPPPELKREIEKFGSIIELIKER